MATESNFDINELAQEAQNRWLKPAEVHFILRNHENYQLTEAPPQKPPSGSLFLFNKRVLRFFRKDGHNWRRKKSGRTVGEGHERLKVGNSEALNCYYAHGEENPNFQRRSYWMLDPAYEHIVLVHYREISEGRHDAKSASNLLPGCSTVSASIYSGGNQGSISDVSKLNTLQESSFSPGSTEVSSELANRKIRTNYLDGTGEFISSPVPDNSQVLQNLQEQLSLNTDDLEGISPSLQESEKYKESEIPNFETCSNQVDPLLHGSGYRDIYETFGLYESNSVLSLPNSGEEYAMQGKEPPVWKDKLDQCPGSFGSYPDGQVPNAPDGNVKLPSSVERVETPANLAEQQERWASHWVDFSGSTSENMNNSQPVLGNSFHLQFSNNNGLIYGSNDPIPSPTSTSLLQEVENSKVSLYSSATSANETISNYCSMFDQESQFRVPLLDFSMSTPAQKHLFEIREISPEWGYTNEETKVIITGSFLCDPSECCWTCMFGNIEVPVEIIQDGVLRCYAPPHVPGNVTLCIASGNREPCSQLREFEYRSCNLPQTDATKSTEELLLLVRFAKLVFCSPLDQRDGITVSLAGTARNPWEHIIQGLLLGSETPSSTVEWLVQELLKDKLQQWLSSKCKERDLTVCSLSKEEQGIIHMVAGLGFEWAVCPVLNSGVSVNFRDVNGWTALHWAARFGREKMVAALIAAGASAGAVTDPTSQDPIGKTAGSIAADYGYKGLAGYLSEVALTSHLSSLTLEEGLPRESAAVIAERAVEKLSNESVGVSEDELSLKDSLAAVRNAAQAAVCIQAAFRAYSFRQRQLRESVDAICEEFGLTLDDIRRLSSSSNIVLNFRNDPKLNRAALSIQKKYRGWKKRQAFLVLRQKIVMIQAHVRGYQVRKRYKVIVWAVGIIDKVVLRWRRGGTGLRGFRPQLESADEIEYEDILKLFRKQKVDMAVADALSNVLSMAQSPDARHQYRRTLENYCQAKDKLPSNASETASTFPDNNEFMEYGDSFQFLWDQILDPHD